MRTLNMSLAVVTGFGLAGTGLVTPAEAAVTCIDPLTASSQVPQQIANDPALLAAIAASETADAKYRSAMASERAIRKLYNTAQAAKNRKTTPAKHTKAVAEYKKVAARLGKAKIATAAALAAAAAASNRLAAIRTELETGMLETLSAYFCVDPSEMALTATPGNDSVTLTWQPVVGADHYVVMRGGERLGVTEDARIVDNTAHNGVTYNYTLYALVDSQPNVVGDAVAPLDLTESTVLSIATASATPTLPVPLNVRATAAVYAANISWNRVPNATAYQIRRDGLLIGSTTGYAYSDTGLTYGQSHSYTVAAVEGSIVSAESVPVSASPRASVLSAPTGLVAVAGNRQVSLSWTPMAGAIRYVVYRDRVKLLETTSVDIVDQGLRNRRAYEYRVSAINIAGESLWSQYVVATPLLPSPTDVVATPGDEEATLTWTAVPDANGYAIWLDGSQIATTNSTSATVTGLSNGIEYELAVTALEIISPTEVISSLRVKVEDIVPRPLVVPAPTGLVGAAGNGQVSLTWNPVDIATSYNIIRGNTIVGTSTNASFVDSALTNGQTYSYTIQAVHGKRTSLQSSAATATPVGAIPVIPTHFSATAGNATVTLNWDISLDATGYQLYRDGVLIASPVTNTYTDTALTNGRTYLYTIAAFSTGGSSPQSAAIAAKPVAAAPSMPTGVVATPGDARVVLTWNVVTGATSYQVYRNGVLAGTVLAPSFTDTGLVNGNSYSYTVVALNSGGSSAASAPVTAVPTVPAPSTPSGLSAFAGNAQVVLSWTPVLGATGYDIYRDGVIVASSTTSSYTDIAVLNGTTYVYAVRATNAGGASAASTTVSATPMPPIPATPTGVTATPGSSQVTLNWTAVSGATSYQVFRNAVLIAQPTGNSFIDTGLTNGTAYTYTIKSVNIAGVSAASAGVTATPAGATLAAPTGLAATAGNAQVVLVWNAVATATTYQVFRDGVQLTTVTTTTYTDTAVTNGTTYAYTVRAVNGATVSADSTSVSATPALASALPSPTGLVADSATNLNTGAFRLKWNAVAGATGYDIYKNGVKIGSSATTTYTPTGIAAATSNTYYVIATNATPSAASLPSASITAAWYQGTAANDVLGRTSYGTIQVYTVITNAKITGCWATYPTSSDSGVINPSAIPQLCSQALTKQPTSATVATLITNITGASATSPAFKTSLQNALTQAGL